MNIFGQVLNKYKKDGLISLFRSTIYWTMKIYVLDKIPAYLSWPFYKIFEKRFEFNGKEYRYYFHPYNKTWTNERAVELPIVSGLINSVDSDRVLEIGNVCSHYFNIKHKVIDLYEKGKNVINQDVSNIVGFSNRFDLIISISTMEHVGWDCGEKVDENKIKQAIVSIKSCLTDSGKFIFSVPIGYNKFLDEMIVNDYFKSVLYLKRCKKREWVVSEKSEAMVSRFGEPFNAANAIAIIKLEKYENSDGVF